jgi:hypothetical protein
MPFDVLNAATDEIRCTYENGEQAGNAARCLNEAERESGSDTRYRVVRRKDEPKAGEWPEWAQREFGRFASCDYRPAPWIYEDWFNGLTDESRNGPDFNMRLYAAKHRHFPHVAKGDPTQIAFTPDDVYGARDGQRRMRVGRYLAQYYSDVLSNERIQELCGQWDTEFGIGLEVKFATTGEDMVRVYQNGPNSCMSHSASDYGGEHPAQVYAAGDLAVAYLERNGEITARTLCWPGKKLYGRVYGDETRMHSLMEALEYEHEDHGDSGNSSEFEGARLLKIPFQRSRTGWLMPWLDHCYMVNDGGEHWVMACDGTYDAQDTSGRMYASPRIRCYSCEERFDSSDGGGVVDDEHYCDSCYADLPYCDDCDERHSGDSHELRVGRRHYSLCEHHYDERTTECHNCGDNHATEDMQLDVNGEAWCETCASDATRNDDEEIDENFVPSDDNESEPARREPTPTIDDPNQLTMVI